MTTYSRRQVLTGSVSTGLGLVVLGAAACKSEPPPLTCMDVSGLKDEEKSQRTLLKYVDTSTDPAKVCLGCAQFKAAAANSCGTCILVKGPIHPKGGCSVWAAKPPA
jgi:hypothetical protein